MNEYTERTAAEKTALEQFAEIDAAVWFDIARNGARKSSVITMRERRAAVEFGRAKMENDPISEAQARYALNILNKFLNFTRSAPVAPFEQPKSDLQLKQPAASRAGVAAIKSRPAR